MFEALKAKFEQNPEFREMLMATGDAYLLEHNETIGRDDYWSDNKNGTGHNMLGKMLMAIRGGQDKPRSEPQGPLLPQDNESVWQNYKAFNEQQEGKRAIPYSIFERGRK